MDALPQDVVLAVDDLRTHFVFRDRSAKSVDGVTFTLKRGQTLAVVGESGSGKSVTSLSIMRLLAEPGRIVGGSILFRDRAGKVHDLARVDQKAMRRIRGREIAMIFQEPMTSLNPLYTVGDQIAEMVMLHERVGRSAGARAERAQMLELVEIPAAASRIDDYPHQMSGGMRQRVMIAMALSCNPSLLIADEPTTALDVTIQAQILNLVRRLQHEIGMSILFVTHNLGVVAEIAHEVAVMYAGRVVEQAPVGAAVRAAQASLHAGADRLHPRRPAATSPPTARAGRSTRSPAPSRRSRTCRPAARSRRAAPMSRTPAPRACPTWSTADAAHLSRCRRHEIL